MQRPEPTPATSSEAGIAMVTVIMGVLAIVLMTVLIQQITIQQTTQSDFQAKEDSVLATTEAILERYAAKLTIDPVYYQRWVDESEGPRVCTDVGSLWNGAQVNPGNPWHEDCQTWDYADVASGAWYAHPLLGGVGGADAASLVHVTPPQSGQSVIVTVAGRHAGHVSPRVVQADIRAESVSEFVRMVEGELRYGPGAHTYGKVYAGERVGYQDGGVAHGNVYAEDRIGGWLSYGAPTWEGGSEGWDSTGNHNAEGEVIRDVYPAPIDFTRFWDDLELLRAAACDGGGICLDPARDGRIPSSVRAYLLETVNAVGQPSQIRVSYATTLPPGASCLDSRERWWVESQDANWQQLDLFDLPVNGALFASTHTVVGRNSTEPFVLGGALTVSAGFPGTVTHIVIGSDVRYVDGLDGTDVLGLVASEDVRINPNGVGSDRILDLYGAILNQGGAMRAAYDCGTGGRNIAPAGSELNTYGSNASQGTGNMSCCFDPRNYNFDDRLARLRPPFFPLLNEEWLYTDWRELPTPCWARDGGCSSGP